MGEEPLSHLTSVFTSREVQTNRQETDVRGGVLAVTVPSPAINLQAGIQEIRRLRDFRVGLDFVVSDWAYTAAENFLRHGLSQYDAMPLIMGVDDGGVLLEWQIGPSTFQIEFTPDRETLADAFDRNGVTIPFKFTMNGSFDIGAREL